MTRIPASAWNAAPKPLAPSSKLSHLLDPDLPRPQNKLLPWPPKKQSLALCFKQMAWLLLGLAIGHSQEVPASHSCQEFQPDPLRPRISPGDLQNGISTLSLPSLGGFPLLAKVSHRSLRKRPPPIRQTLHTSACEDYCLCMFCGCGGYPMCRTLN